MNRTLEARRMQQDTATARVSVAEGYERWARTYDQALNPLLAREERYLVPRLPNLNGKKVLDLACGTGRWLQRLLDTGAQSGIGVDLSIGMLRVGAGKPVLRQKLVQADLVRLPLEGPTFDFAICSFAAGHIRNLRGFFHELARVIKPGGRLVVSDLHPAAISFGWRTGFRDEAGPAEIDSRLHTVDTVLQESAASGFKRRSCATLHLEEPEKPIFRAAGKLHIFEEALRVPAVFVLVLDLEHRE